MRKKIVAGNWKMNTDLIEAATLAKAIKEHSNNITDVEKIVFAPFPFLKTVNDITNEEKNFYTGAQNCSEHVKGAYTGETSAQMVASLGCKYVLVGHSERRAYFNESSRQILAKLLNGIDAGLEVILCFGEQLEERKAGRHFATVEAQLKEVIAHVPLQKAGFVALAYEPVWAIGTGETATPAQAQEMHAFARGTIATIFNERTAANMSIIYGGSCNAQNARSIFAGPDVDGGLIGGASLKAMDFCHIIASFP
jgi:triosephosphate isomerase